jgi:phosphatidylethanolamine-binding protein (PEBP) family uncharacterized protein
MILMHQVDCSRTGRFGISRRKPAPWEKAARQKACKGQMTSANRVTAAPVRPSGTHRYYFKIFALDRELDLPFGAKRGQLDAAMKGHVVAQGELMGRYSRQK